VKFLWKKCCLFWGKDSVYISHTKRCVYCIWSGYDCNCTCTVHVVRSLNC